MAYTFRTPVLPSNCLKNLSLGTTRALTALDQHGQLMEHLLDQLNKDLYYYLIVKFLERRLF